MAENQEQNRGSVLMEWAFPEFEQHDRSRAWYLVAFAVFVVSIVIAAFSRNYTFIAVLLLFSLVILIRLRRQPPDVRFAIRDEGLEVGQRFYAWKELKEFWILYRPPEVKKVYFHFKSTLRPALDISLMDQNPLKVRQALSERLLENTDLEDEPTGDQITRFLKI